MRCFTGALPVRWFCRGAAALGGLLGSLLGGLGFCLGYALGFGAFRSFGPNRLPGRGFGGFLARFLGHTPSFRRFRKLNHGDIAGSCWETGNEPIAWPILRPRGMVTRNSTHRLSAR